MSRIFFSEARGDDVDLFDPKTSFIARLHRDRTAYGFEVWLDRMAMPSRGLTFHQEIQDAVAARERLVLLVGPKAALSDYVRQEWQFALHADKTVTPILRQGDYPLVPDELKLLHCEDFRDDAQHAFHLENLVRQLREPVPPLGKLIAVPSLPAHYLAREDRLHGAAAFDFATARTALADGFPPDTISSDLYGAHLGRTPRHDLLRVLSILIAAGMPETDAFAAVTHRPAAILGLAGEIGTLAVGTCADLTVLRQDTATGIWEAALTVREGIVIRPTATGP